ncbi:DUF2249 domain-containing protein [bacterium]|nr:DUF2249 domain-containing protein [bacterium]
MTTALKFRRFDVRKLIETGAEVLPLILQRVTQLRAGEGIVVIAPFLPSPLIERLNSEGFASRVERGGGSDWLVYFWREAG